MPDTVAIVGGGPAGAFAAELLARSGRKVLLIEEKLAWEKPCGGGITDKALTRYPFLREAPVERNWVDECEFISPSGRRAYLELDRPIAIFSRHVLNGLMLEGARQAGAELLQERVTAIHGTAGDWQLTTRSGQFHAEYLVLAAGGRNPFRALFAQPFKPDDLMATAGYYVRGSSPRMLIKFIPAVAGYIWSFPRRDHFSAGICGKMDGHSTQDLRRMLEGFLREEKFEIEDAPFYSHVLPALSERSLRQLEVQGEGWAMIGDAAGFVDPITGEGLYYAFRSAELLAQALLAGSPEEYERLIAADFLPELQMAAHIADRFFFGNFLGGGVIERMVQFTQSSPSFRALMCDLFAGAQSYIGLKRRAYRQLLPSLVEIFVHHVFGDDEPTPRQPAQGAA
jgi:geranylgeranyl diphosphate/geranylgeranyl-bacteriochlorophyllide a reductase